MVSYLRSIPGEMTSLSNEIEFPEPRLTFLAAESTETAHSCTTLTPLLTARP